MRKSLAMSFMKSETVVLIFCLSAAIFKLSTAASEDTYQNSYASKQKNICGQYCLVSVFRYLGKNVQLEELLPAVPKSDQGSNLAQLKLVAEAYGLKTLGAKVSKDILFSMARPAILHVNGNHFIALLPGKTGTNFIVIDPPQSFTITGPEQLTPRWKWKGKCLFVDEKEITLPKNRSVKRIKIWYCGTASVFIFIIILIYKELIRLRKATKISTIAKMLLFVGLPVLINTSSCRDKREQEASGGSEPRIFVANPVFDAGIVFDDTNVILPTFKITNKGTADLVIREIKTDCGCTAAVTEKKRVEPGESLILTVNFHMAGRFGKLAERKTLIKTNDPKTPETVFIIKAERRREFSLKPSGVLLGVVPMGTDKILLMRITPGEESKRLSIEKASTSSPFIEVTQIKDEIKPKKANEYLLKVRLAPTAPAGLLNEVIRIPCSGASRKTLEIPVRGEVIGPIRASLSEIQFGLMRLSEKEKAREVSLNSNRAFNVLKIYSTRDWLTAITRKIDDKEYVLTVEVIPTKAPKGKLTGTIMVETNSTEMPKINIPVFAFRM